MSNVVDFLVELIQKESITPNESGIFELIKCELSDFECITKDKNGVKNIFLYKNFSPLSNHPLHLCFGGHIDVVPSGNGWLYPPFLGKIVDNVIYGRGAQDMKGGVASFIYAIKNIKSFNGILSLLLTSDEEGDGVYGTRIMLEELKYRKLLPNFAIVAEPTCIENLGDTIKVGRRGSINGVLRLYGVQGHVAYPHKCKNPVDLIANILPNLSSYSLDKGDDIFSESKIIITDIRAGMEVVNVTPSELKIMFNVRNNPHSNIDTLRNYIDGLFDGLDYKLELKQSSYPFISKSKLLIDMLSVSIKEVLGITPNLSTSGGTSDARYFSEFGVEVLEFGLLNDKIHAVDECVKLEDVVNLVAIFEKFIFNMSKNAR